MSTGPVSLELQSRIAEWRLRVAEGTITPEEMKEAISMLRAGRLTAASAASASRKKSSAVAPAAGDMLSELEGL